MALVHCDRPDLLFLYIGGGAGRAIIHIAMLSPELHSWSNLLEAELSNTPIADHAATKLEFFKKTIFPTLLTKNHAEWKKYEPNPWDATFEKTKTFIRHEWMRETLDFINKYAAKKIAYLDFKSHVDFCINAAVQKKALMIVSMPAGENIATWSARPNVEVSIILQQQKEEALAALKRWKEYRKTHVLHSVNLGKFFFSSHEDFLSEYYSLCNFYEITPVVDEATKLRNHWISLHDTKY